MTPAVRVRAAAPVALPWNTLELLKASMYGLWALVAVLLLAAISGAHVHRGAMQVVGKDTVPSIIAAQHIKSALADMDANAANELLGKPGEMPEAVKSYEARRTEAATALIDAAKNITYAAERDPLEKLQLGLGTFEGKVQRARDLHESQPTGTAFITAYREAAKEMDQTLLPAADALDKANHNELEDAYESESKRSTVASVVYAIVALAFLGLLIRVQMFLNKRTHRTLNLPLLAATLLTLVFVMYAMNSMAVERHELKAARVDAFESIHALWRARAIGYAANADESRYLLDPANAAEHERNFNAKADSMAKVPAGVAIERVTKDTPGFSGYLADEMKNITFEGEAAAADETLVWFGKYVAIDHEIRRLQESGKHAEALQLCIGTRKDESNYAYDRFDTALGNTLKINQDAFDDSVAKGMGALAGFEWKSSGLALVIAALVFFGLNARIREYQ